MDLPRDEIAFRKDYEKLVVAGSLTTIFRPGNRIFPNYRGYKLAEVVTARIIEKPGSDVEEIPPLFNDIKIRVSIEDIEAVNVYALQPDAFSGSSPDVQNVKDLLQHLEHIYREPISAFDNVITRISLRYLEQIDASSIARSAS